MLLQAVISLSLYRNSSKQLLLRGDLCATRIFTTHNSKRSNSNRNKEQIAPGTFKVLGFKNSLSRTTTNGLQKPKHCSSKIKQKRRHLTINRSSHHKQFCTPSCSTQVLKKPPSNHPNRWKHLLSRLKKGKKRNLSTHKAIRIKTKTKPSQNSRISISSL